MCCLHILADTGDANPWGSQHRAVDQGRRRLAKLVWNVHRPGHLCALSALIIWVMGTGIGYIVLSAFLYV